MFVCSFLLSCSAGAVLLVSSIGGYVPFPVSLQLVCTSSITVHVYCQSDLLHAVDAWSLFCKQNCSTGIDKSTS